MVMHLEFQLLGESFDDCYNTNPLVNAFSAGIMKKDEMISAFKGPGNPVFIVGSHTGKDGIHGASFASKDITEDSAEDLPVISVVILFKKIAT